MTSTSLLDSINQAPSASTADVDNLVFLQEFHAQLARLEDPALRKSVEAFAAAPKGDALLRLMGAYSPYLSQTILRRFAAFAAFCQHSVDDNAQRILSEFTADISTFRNTDAIMRHLRILKSQAALLTAMADLSNTWSVEQVTRFLSEVAAKSLQIAIDYLLHDAYQRGELPHIDPAQPSKDSGFIILAMGKLGAYELNYSSDIDLIILFESEKMQYAGKQSLQHCMSRITRDLVHIMQERTMDGYVFRTDIRLRPDPASTPPALSVGAAITYYETTGQNWERAAMIKARAIAGDIPSGQQFLKSLTPFIWRRNLDFAAIADIHSIKRQIDHRTGNSMQLAGHNLKLGLGGIRELEFFVQVQQLIWGGRNSDLRTRATCETLYGLAGIGIISHHDAIDLTDSYRFLRKMEHRVQMQRDQQNHCLPTEVDALKAFAAFAGYSDFCSFEGEVLYHLQQVKSHYTKLYGTEDSLGMDGSLVFTGVDPDPATLDTLKRMGFQQPERVCDTIMNWHRGHRRSTRNKRARERLTEMTPTLLQALASTADPDSAFIKFDEFLSRLPAGVQIFSLFAANPQLLKLIANILGSAPKLAKTLSRNPGLLDAVLTGAFYAPLPNRETLEEELAQLLTARAGLDDTVNILCQFKNEKIFQAGIQLLNNIAGHESIGAFLTSVAEIILDTLVQQLSAEFAETYGHIPGSELAIIAMGRLGAQELTFASDLDLIFVYDTPEPDALSDGEKPFTASVYYNRLCQRLVGALTSLNREGRLYEIDTRLRPLGKDGPLATSLAAFDQYFDSSAWTFEFMALTRARVVAGGKSLSQRLSASIAHHLDKPRDAGIIRHDVAQMREKVAQEFGTKNPWHIKYIRGGLMDIDFLHQYWRLTHTQGHKGLDEAQQFYTHLLHLLRLCSGGTLEEDTAPEGLKTLLYTHLGFASFEELKQKLIQMEQHIHRIYQHILGQEIAYD